jgi:hypothetical protein
MTSNNENCVQGAQNTERILAHTQWITAIEKRQVRMEDILDKVRNRPPVWITFVMAILTGVIGWLLKGGGT